MWGLVLVTVLVFINVNVSLGAVVCRDGHGSSSYSDLRPQTKHLKLPYNCSERLRSKVLEYIYDKILLTSTQTVSKTRKMIISFFFITQDFVHLFICLM